MKQELIICEPKRIRLSNNAIKYICWSRKNNNSIYNFLRISFGIDILNDLNIKKGDKLIISYPKDNNRILHIKKSSSSEGYTLSKNKKTSVYSTTLIWYQFSPTDKDKKTKIVPHKIIDNEIIIDIS